MKNRSQRSWVKDIGFKEIPEINTDNARKSVCDICLVLKVFEPPGLASLDSTFLICTRKKLPVLIKLRKILRH